MLWRHDRSAGPCRQHCRLMCDIGGIRLRRSAEINYTLSQCQLTLWATQPLITFLGRQRLHQGVGVGKTDILAGKANQSARDETGILTRSQHAR